MVYAAYFVTNKILLPATTTTSAPSNASEYWMVVFNEINETK